MIGIIGAMDEEIHLFKKNIQKKRETKTASLRLIEGTVSGKEIVLVKSGVGKVNAAMCTQLLIDKFNCSTIIMTGVAGSISPNLKTGDTIVALKCVQHDLDATGLGFKRGQVPFTEHTFFNTDKKISEQAIESGKKLGLKIIGATIATGDVFVQDKKIAQSIRNEFKAEAVDMESAAVAQTCFLNNVPVGIIKAISDGSDQNSPSDFGKFLSSSAENSFKLVKELLNEIKTK